MMKFKGLALSIFLTVVLVACGQKKHTTLELRYGKHGLIVSSLVEDPTPVTDKDAAYTPGERLLKTAWGQSAPFDSTLPLINGERPVVGCVNTAMAQLLYYYQYPQKGRGVILGKLASTDQWADLNQPINWSLIEQDHRKMTTKAQEEEIGELLRKMAVVNKTSLATAADGGSSTSTSYMVKNLVKHFGFSNYPKQLDATAGAIPKDVIDFIKFEIDNKRPLFLSLHGTLNHLVIIDGYKIEGDQFLVHLNMGWEGLHDKFYSLNQAIEVKQTFERDGSLWERTLTADEFSIFGQIAPCKDDCYSSLESEDKITNNEIMGNFSSYSDEDIFGPFGSSYEYSLSFISNHNYSNNPFYVSIINEFGQVLEDTTSSFSFSALEKFYVRISPASAVTGRYFQYNGEYKVKLEKLGPSSTQATPREFELNSSENILVLEENENIDVRLSVFPYAPEEVTFKSNNGTEIVSNILSIHAGLLPAGELSLIKVDAFSGDQLITTKEIKVFVSKFKFHLGTKQSINGKFASSNEEIIVFTALKGKCHIHGNRGYSNQAFFISVDGHESTEEVIQREFELGIYPISVSLKKGYSSYPFSEAYSNFKIFVDCSESDYTLEQLLEVI